MYVCARVHMYVFMICLSPRLFISHVKKETCFLYARLSVLIGVASIMKGSAKKIDGCMINWQFLTIFFCVPNIAYIFMGAIFGSCFLCEHYSHQ